MRLEWLYLPAHEAYRKLLAQCPSAAPERPELAEAKAYLTN